MLLINNDAQDLSAALTPFSVQPVFMYFKHGNPSYTNQPKDPRWILLHKMQQKSLATATDIFILHILLFLSSDVNIRITLKWVVFFFPSSYSCSHVIYVLDWFGLFLNFINTINTISSAGETGNTYFGKKSKKKKTKRAFILCFYIRTKGETIKNHVKLTLVRQKLKEQKDVNWNSLRKINPKNSWIMETLDNSEVAVVLKHFSSIPVL